MLLMSRILCLLYFAVLCSVVLCCVVLDYRRLGVIEKQGEECMK